MRKKRSLISLGMLCVVGFLFGNQLLAQDSFEAKVAWVVDGDTIRLTGGEYVRYIGIDTPETVHPETPVEWMGKEASDFNTQLVDGKTIRLEFDAQKKDKYNRLLAYVYVGDVFVNAELVRQGFAQVSTYPPNVKYQDLLLEMQKEAREAKHGLWGVKKEVADAQNLDNTVGEVYITKSGKKYHKGTSMHLRKSRIPIKLDDAKARGYGACATCFGGSSSSNSSPSGSVSRSKSSSSSRCQATTKKGTQRHQQRCGSPVVDLPFHSCDCRIVAFDIPPPVSDHGTAVFPLFRSTGVTYLYTANLLPSIWTNIPIVTSENLAYIRFCRTIV